MSTSSQQTQRTKSDGVDTCETTVRKSVRKTAGRNPARLTEADGQQPLIKTISATLPTSRKVICGKTGCGKTVDEGIECSNCLKWYHHNCGGLSSQEFSDHMTEDDKLWFCLECSSIPLFRFLTTIIKRQERQISALENRLSCLERPKAQITQTTIESNNSNTTNILSDTGPTTKMNNENNQQPFMIVNCNKQPPVQDKNNEDLTIICTNVAEPKSISLKARHEEELKNWQTVCQSMGLNIHPSSLTRLSRPRSSPHAGEPRLLRVTLKNMKDVEDILLSSHLLRNESTAVRIFPDIPWSERQKIRKDPITAKTVHGKKMLMIHGIPESNDDNGWNKKEHDHHEWKFIQDLLGIKDVLTTRLSRLPHSPNYQGIGPRILKVSLLNEKMVESVVETWRSNKTILPPELKLRTFLSPKRVECENPTGPRVDHIQTNSHHPLSTSNQNDSVTSNVPFQKNDCHPTPSESE